MSILGVEIGIVLCDSNENEQMLIQREYSFTEVHATMSSIERVRMVCDCIYTTDEEFSRMGYEAYTLIPVIHTTSGDKLMTYEGRGRLAH